jgi:carbon monoxide dehydrogenase subunit G
MAKASGTVTSPLPPETVFERVSDFSTTQLWDPGVVEGEKLTEGPVEIGARFRIVARFMGRNSELVYVVTEFEPGRRVVLRGENATVLSIDEIIVEPVESGGSRLDYSADLTLKGPLALFDPLLGMAFSGIAKKALAGLSAWLSE